MGSFCQQYGGTPLRAPSNPKNKKTFSKGRSNFRYHKKKPYKENSEFYKAPYNKRYGKKPYKNSFTKSKDKDIKCYKCGSFDHYTNKCEVQKKINQLENLNITKELKDSLITTLKAFYLILMKKTVLLPRKSRLVKISTRLIILKILIQFLANALNRFCNCDKKN